jgi:NAD(P)-dependent dehydrogenase (short-subunit alcohol dehydrogenase family)
LIDRLRESVSAEVPSAVIVPAIDGTAVPVEDLDDELIRVLFEDPMNDVIMACQQAFRDGCRRVVVVVPTTAMSGGAQYAATAALAEAARILVKSAARQWGAHGVTVNAVAVEPRWFGIDAEVAGPVSIAAPALGVSTTPLDPSPVVTWLCGDAAGTTTGQTIVCDGGTWM